MTASLTGVKSIEPVSLSNMEEGRSSTEIQESIHQGRKWTLWPSSFGSVKVKRAVVSLSSLGLIAGIAGTVLYTNPPSDTVKLVGLVLLAVGWPVCCCGGTLYSKNSFEESSNRI